MKINGTVKAMAIILTLVVTIGGIIWRASAYTTKTDNRLDTLENNVEVLSGNQSQILRLLLIQHIADSLSDPTLIERATSKADSVVNDTK